MMMNYTFGWTFVCAQSHVKLRECHPEHAVSATDAPEPESPSPKRTDDKPIHTWTTREVDADLILLD